MKNKPFGTNFRIKALLLCALLLVSAFALCGCTKDFTDFDNDSLPMPASDESVKAKWDEYPILKTVPRYNGGGIFDVIAEPSGDAVNVYYNGTTAEDYEDYNALLKQSGFKLKDGSAVWSSEGALGVPQYTKGEIQLTLVWSADGTFAICVAYK